MNPAVSHGSSAVLGGARRYQRHLTANGMTLKEERALARAWNEVKSGKARIISSEEMRRKIELESRV